MPWSTRSGGGHARRGALTGRLRVTTRPVSRCTGMHLAAEDHPPHRLPFTTNALLTPPAARRPGRRSSDPDRPGLLRELPRARELCAHGEGAAVPGPSG